MSILLSKKILWECDDRKEYFIIIENGCFNWGVKQKKNDNDKDYEEKENKKALLLGYKKEEKYKSKVGLGIFSLMSFVFFMIRVFLIMKIILIQ